MSLAECPHCVTNVIFLETNICPACGKNRNINSTKSREAILAEQEQEQAQLKRKLPIIKVMDLKFYSVDYF